MSGFEIVGVALGSAPLAIELFDRWEATAETFSRFKHHSSEAQTYHTQLDIQRAKFLSDFGSLESSLRENKHLVRQLFDLPPAADERPERGLRLHLKTLNKQIHIINSQLEPMCLKWEKLTQEIEEQESVTDLQVLRNIGSRFKVAFRATDKEQELTKLRGLCTDFHLSVENITKGLRDLGGNTNNNARIRHSPSKGISLLSKYRQHRAEAVQLHSALSKWICSSHQRHSFQVRVPHEESSIDTKAGTPGEAVILEFAVSHHDEGVPSHDEPLLIEVRQIGAPEERQLAHHGEDLSVEPLSLRRRTQRRTRALLAELRVSLFPLLRRRPSNSTKTDLRQTQASHIADPAPANLHADGPSIAGPPIGNSASPHKPIIDMLQCGSFCDSIIKTTAERGVGSCLGSWVSPPTLWYTVPRNGPFRSLDEYLNSISKESTTIALAPSSKIELSLRVAEGIMQLYATPWLAQTNLSTNIRGTGLDIYEDQSSTGKLYFIGLMDPGESVNKQPDPLVSISKIGGVGPRGGRNVLLFNFGILLLEIGLERPWARLKEEFERQHQSLPEDPRADVAIADRVAAKLANRMGRRYWRITMKCINCDFGAGHADMDTEELQGLFVQDVVLPLRELRAEVSQGRLPVN